MNANLRNFALWVIIVLLLLALFVVVRWRPVALFLAVIILSPSGT